MSKDVKRMSLEQAESFTSDQVTSAIKSCMSRRAYGPDTLSISHLKNLGPLATEHLTSLYNYSLKSCRLSSIWKTSLVIPISKPGKNSYRHISLLCPAAKVLEALILPSINKFLSPAKDQHGFRPRHSTTSVLLQLTTDIETGFNQRKPPHHTVCVAIDLTAAFDTVSHDTLISKMVEKEDHVSHGITIQEPRPRPMKETLHSRHHSTVLPRHGSNRMESHQNLHIHAVDPAIQLQGNNRVLKKRPPPISDEEQRLNRRQRCTLSQLRSEHCHHGIHVVEPSGNKRRLQIEITIILTVYCSSQRVFCLGSVRSG